MTPGTLTALIYLLTGAAIIYYFQDRRRALSALRPDVLPELPQEDYQRLTVLLKTAYERMLYLGILFFPLAWTSLNRDRVGGIFFMTLIFLLFLANIPPRHGIMALLGARGLDTDELRRRGIRL